MSTRFYLEFAKTGLVRYTSHLDLLRLFKRAFKRTEVPIAYSQGFNPHPRMSFAQPLSLGYTAAHEYLEFQTDREIAPEEILRRMRSAMPMGLTLLSCRPLEIGSRTLASLVTAAEFTITLPVAARDVRLDDFRKLCDDYLAQPAIIASKRQKKTKKYADQDIRPQIRDLKPAWEPDEIGGMDLAGNGNVCLRLLCDQGSASNLNPDLVVQTLLPFGGALTAFPREEIEICREKLFLEAGTPALPGLYIESVPKADEKA
ncbi:MAG: TIGR03936 family radical SAM-associated protein [Clostridia bacterium]|nr:TIGR03936 family radical SAM-associated protein [Clostridia bacterium]